MNRTRFIQSLSRERLAIYIHRVLRVHALSRKPATAKRCEAAWLIARTRYWSMTNFAAR